MTKEIKLPAGTKQALAQQEPNPWQEAVIDQLVVHHIYQAAHDTDPHLAIHHLLCISNQIALDPQVSSDAQALIDRGRREAQQEQPAQEPYGWVRPNPGFNSGLCNIGAVCPTGWIGSAHPVYTHPAPTQPALRDSQLNVIFNMTAGYGRDDYISFARAIEAHCRGSNHG